MDPFCAPLPSSYRVPDSRKKTRKNEKNNSCCGFLPLLHYLSKLKTPHGFVLRDYLKRVHRPTCSGRDNVPFNEDGALFFGLCMWGWGIAAIHLSCKDRMRERISRFGRHQLLSQESAHPTNAQSLARYTISIHTILHIHKLVIQEPRNASNLLYV